ncbi:hypothetical protein L596_019231 [Steinernema carpocapsae]|uniref:Uncharacterized protein n=1 Tax=Steinernema carpocapsae TaxID=34508 RepID=A0A4U5MPV7_STECR|nr:hypothetical protein L596_019231 [Steinernema carpocapsae]
MEAEYVPPGLNWIMRSLGGWCFLIGGGEREERDDERRQHRVVPIVEFEGVRRGRRLMFGPPSIDCEEKSKQISRFGGERSVVWTLEV